jgi:hypothetical protein
MIQWIVITEVMMITVSGNYSSGNVVVILWSDDGRTEYSSDDYSE